MDKDKLKEAVEQFLTAWDTGRATSISTAITRLKDANKPTKQEVVSYLSNGIDEDWYSAEDEQWIQYAIDFLEKE